MTSQPGNKLDCSRERRHLSIEAWPVSAWSAWDPIATNTLAVVAASSFRNMGNTSAIAAWVDVGFVGLKSLRTLALYTSVHGMPNNFQSN
jgi:hypothetical protein